MINKCASFLLTGTRGRLPRGAVAPGKLRRLTMTATLPALIICGALLLNALYRHLFR